jgi:aminopeptidase N
VHRHTRYADQVIADFYARWQHDQLVLDKWFMIQAMIPASDALSNVETLLQHPDFSLSNPNRVRSCLGAFCSANPVGFHANAGAGYQLLAKHVEILDRINPQVAARMSIPLTRWRRYDEARQTQMKQALQQLRDIKSLSRDVYELVDKSLD